MDAPFPINPVLTGVALAYENRRMIADLVAPRKNVDGEQFKYYKHELKEKITVPDTKVGRKSLPNEVEFGLVEVDSSTEDHGLDDFVPYKDIKNAKNIPNYDPKSNAAMNLTDIILLAREIRTANMIFDPDKYHNDNKLTLAGNSQWSDYANSDPVDDIKYALDGMVVRANEAVFGRPVWSKISSHPKILAAVKGNNVDSGIARREAVADLFELDRIHVGDAFVNYANPGQQMQRERCWGNHCSLIVNDPLADFKNKRPTFALTAQWGSRISGDIPDKKRGLLGGVTVRVGEQVRELTLADDLGFFFEDAVA